jgi:hypothetical protein
MSQSSEKRIYRALADSLVIAPTTSVNIKLMAVSPESLRAALAALSEMSCCCYIASAFAAWYAQIVLDKVITEDYRAEATTGAPWEPLLERSEYGFHRQL